MLLIIPLKKAFSDSARKASIEARRKKAAARLTVPTTKAAPVRHLGNQLEIEKFLDDAGWTYDNSSAQALSELERKYKVPTEEIIGCLSAVEDGHKGLMMDGDKLYKSVYVRKSPSFTTILASVRNEKVVGRTVWERSFNDDGTVDMDLFSMNSKLQGKGVGKEVFKKQLDLFDKMGMKKLRVHAALEVGGYAWLRHGYEIDRPTDLAKLATKVRKFARDGMADGSLSKAAGGVVYRLGLAARTEPKVFWLLADSPHGKKLFAGDDWHGSLDLDKKSLARQRLENYIGVKK